MEPPPYTLQSSFDGEFHYDLIVRDKYKFIKQLINISALYMIEIKKLNDRINELSNDQSFRTLCYISELEGKIYAEYIIYLFKKRIYEIYHSPSEELVASAASATISTKLSAIPAKSSAIPAKSSAISATLSTIPAKSSAITAKSSAIPDKSSAISATSSAITDKSSAISATSSVISIKLPAIPDKSSSIQATSSSTLATSLATPEVTFSIPTSSSDLLRTRKRKRQSNMYYFDDDDDDYDDEDDKEIKDNNDESETTDDDISYDDNIIYHKKKRRNKHKENPWCRKPIHHKGRCNQWICKQCKSNNSEIMCINKCGTWHTHNLLWKCLKCNIDNDTLPCKICHHSYNTQIKLNLAKILNYDE